MRGTIEIDSLRLHACHGVAEQERIVGNIFDISVSLAYPVDKAVETDNIEDTLNYAAVIQVIKKEMKIPSLLLEHVAGRIVKALINEFPLISGGRIKLTKVTPPCGAELKGVSVILEW
ncbi:MAG: dihydroneopterin aldolase [Paramuribaculum sp.]|nr:dihydroneopterin aldolase [Paramuribaculum sp.]